MIQLWIVASLWILAKASHDKAYPGYVGCFLDSRHEVNFTSEYRMTERTMTIQQCSAYCFLKGYTYLATKKGNECYCGDLQFDNLPKPDDDKLCDIPCLSDSSANCGGKNALAVYSTGIKESEVVDIAKMKIGCLSDTDDTRLIPEHKGDLTKTNTPKRCIAYCRALGYPHAGLQYGMECFCGLARRTTPIVEGCDLPCSGTDSDETCGGHWKLDLYTTGKFNISTDIKMSGCFTYDKDISITGTTFQDMTPNKCVAHCFRQAMPYAHIFNGIECLCGRESPKSISRVATFKCDIPCQGDENHICGGETFILTYTTGVVGNPILGKQESCYDDSSDLFLQGVKFNLGMESSVDFCISRCIELGYAFAGLHNTNECQCTQESPPRHLRRMAPNDLCNSPCPRIELQNCGGEKHLALYRTGISSYREKVSGHQQVSGYIGCFKSNRNEIRLTGHQMNVRSIRVNECNALCFSKGFKYSATKNGKECSCGDLDGPLPKSDEERLCNVKCSSDFTSNCGGRDAFSLYSTGIKDDDIDLEELEIGCLRDSDDIRLIPEHKIDLSLTNSPKRCIAYCRALGYIHAGVQYSMECYCGTARMTYPIIEGCDKECTGDPDFLCGGDWKANVYSTGLARSVTGITTRGCFNYNSTLVATSKTISKMNPNKCVAHCYQQGYSFAFIHSGIECHCGEKLISKYRTSGDKCSIICDSDQGSKCGGNGYMTAYTTGIQGKPSLGKLLGCYKDQDNQLLPGPLINLGVDNGITLCISKCIELGYAYAGLRNTFECHCSQTIPKRTPVKIVPDYECSSACPILQLETCGSPLFTAIHRTGVIPRDQEEECKSSMSTLNGRNACGGQILFQDNFDTLDTEKWHHSVKISGEDNEFVMYTKKKKNVHVENGKLIIKPTLIKESFVKYGTIDLHGCTEQPNSPDCTATAKSYNILPPVESGQICTKRSISFKYGVITVRAKLPKGDWIIPQIWLRSSAEIYGEGYLSGKMIIVMSRGNENLVDTQGNNIGANLAESGFQVSTEPLRNIQTSTEQITGSEPWFNSFHNYTLTWTPDTILFYVDGNVLSQLKTIYKPTETSLVEQLGLEKQTHWGSSNSIVAPFDQEFYICIGVSVGGMRSFPDNTISNGTKKPWKNDELKSRLNFFLSKNDWEPTWSEDTKLEVDSVKITAF